MTSSPEKCSESGVNSSLCLLGVFSGVPVSSEEGASITAYSLIERTNPNKESNCKFNVKVHLLVSSK